MQTKVGLTTLIQNYKFSVSSKTKQPLTMKVSAPVLTADGNILLNSQKL